MATLRSIVELNDKVSSRLETISKHAIATDKALRSVDVSLEKLSVTAGETGRKFNLKMAEMRESSRGFRMGVSEDLRIIKAELLSLTARKQHIKIEADTGAAMTQIAILKRELASVRRGHTFSIGAGAQRSAGVLFGGGGGGGSRGGSFLSGGGGNASRGALSGINANIGPLGLSGKALSTLIPTAGPAAISAIAGAVGILTTNVVALGGALVATTSLVGALVVGIAAIGVPIGLAVKSTVSWYQKMTSASAILEKTRSGTKAYTTALNNYNRVMRTMPEDQRKVITHFQDLKVSWHNLVTEGQSGRRALDIINSGLVTAKNLMPFVAKTMDRFTDRAAVMFNAIRRDSPQLSKLLDKTMAPWPGYFQKGGIATYQFGKGLLGVMRAAKPFTDYLINGLSKLTGHFAKWANSRGGQKTMTTFFTGLIPVFNELVVLGGKIFGAMFKIAADPSMQRNTIKFTKLLEKFVDGLPDFIVKMSEAASKLGPVIQLIVGDIRDLANDIAPFIDKLFGSLGKVHDMTKGVPDGLGPIADGLLVFAGIKGLKSVASGIFSIGGSISSLVLNVGKKALGIDKLTTAIKGLAGAQTALDIANAGGGVGGGVPAAGVGGGRFKRWRDARKASRALKALPAVEEVGLGGASAALPFAGSAAFGRGTSLAAQHGSMSALGGSRAGQAAVGADRLGLGAVTTMEGSGVAGGALGVSALGTTAEAGAGGALAAPIVAAGASIGLVVAVAAAGAASIAYAWKKNFGDVRETVSTTWKEVSGSFSHLGDSISKFFNAIGIDNKSFADLAGKTWGTLKRVFGGVGEILLDAIAPAFHHISVIVNDVADTLISIADFIKSPSWKGAFDIAKNVAITAFDGITAPIQYVFGVIQGAIKTIAGWVGVDIGGTKGTAAAATGGQNVSTSGDVTTVASPNVTSGGGSTVVGGKGKGATLKGTGDAPLSVLAGIGSQVSGIASSVGGAISSAASGGASVVGKGINAGIGALEGTVLNSLNPLDNFGTVGKVAKAGFRNIYVDAKKKLLSVAGLGNVGIGGQSKIKGGLDLGGLAMPGDTSGLGKIGGVNAHLVGLVSDLHKKFGVVVGSGTGGTHSKGSWHSSGDAVDLWGTHAELQQVWNSLVGQPGIGQLLWNGQQEYNGGKVSPITTPGVGDWKHTGHVHVGMRGDAPESVLRAARGVTGGSGGALGLNHHGPLVHIENANLNSSDDIDKVAEELAHALKKHLDNIPMEDATEMSH